MSTSRLGMKQHLYMPMLLVAVSWIALSTNTFAQTAAPALQNADPGQSAYDAVSIKPGRPSDGNGMRSMPDGFVWTNVPLSSLVSSAYGVMYDQVSGLPEWATSEPYEIEAKVDADTVEALKQLSAKERRKREQGRMQAILADRCRFKAHWETRQLPVYDLLIARNGLKMKEAPPGEPLGETWDSSGTMLVHAMPAGALAVIFSGSVGRMIVDKTGLGERKFDFELKWSPDDLKSADNPMNAAPALFTALEEQLGLKLVSSKGPVQVLVVDHIERPSQN